MKLYTPPEMSKKLVAMGCVSQSSAYYLGSENVFTHLTKPPKNGTPAFEFEDFAGQNQQALKNRMLLKWLQRDRLFETTNWVEEVGRGL